MENLLTILIAVFVALSIIRMVMSTAKTFINIALIIVASGVILHFFSPETLNNLIGEDNHNKSVEIFEDGMGKGKEVLEDVVKNVGETGVEIIKDKLDNQ